MREATERRTADELKEDKSNKVTSFQSKPDHEHYASEKLLFDSLQAIAEKIALEVNRAYESENFIYNELLKEKSFAEDADAALHEAITNEEGRAIAEESKIKSSVEVLQKFVEYKNLLLLNSLILQGYTTIGEGVLIAPKEISSGCYSVDADFRENASILTAYYELSYGTAYKIKSSKLSNSAFANIVFFDSDGNVYPYSVDLQDRIFVPDKFFSRIALSYTGQPSTVLLFEEEQVVARIADASVQMKMFSSDVVEKINDIVQSVSNEVERAKSAEEGLSAELTDERSFTAETFAKMQSQLENEIIRSIVVDKNLLKRVDSLEGKFVILSEDEYNSIEYKNDDTIYFVIEG